MTRIKPVLLAKAPVLIPILLALLFLGACSKKKEAESEAPAPVQVTTATQDTVRRLIAGDGTLWPRNQASGMPKIAAPVQRLLVQRGDRVRQGSLPRARAAAHVAAS